MTISEKYRSEPRISVWISTYQHFGRHIRTVKDSTGLDRGSRLCYSEFGYESPIAGVGIQKKLKVCMLAPAQQTSMQEREEQSRRENN
jgi:hypothetical protein